MSDSNEPNLIRLDLDESFDAPAVDDKHVNVNVENVDNTEPTQSDADSFSNPQWNSE